MKIRFLKDTHIRISPDTRLSPIGYIYKGAEIEVAPNTLVGENVRGNNIWYHDHKNEWYYWSGMAIVIENKVQEPAPPPPPPPKSYPPYPSFGTMTSMSEGIDIPKGETRIVPPFETLQMIEEGFQNAIAEEQHTTDQKEEVVEQLHLSTPPVSSIESNNLFPTVPINIWDKAIDKKQLNWGIRKYKLQEDWWKNHKITGKGVKIALLSTGVNPHHPDLGNVSDWYLYEGASKMDAHDLGNQAAVVCAGTGHHVYGVAPDANLLIAKIGEQDHAIRPDALITGLQWAIQAEVDIIGILVDFPSLKAAQVKKLEALIKKAEEKDILLLAPVGNSDSKKPISRYPARMDGVISVGAHSELGNRTAFSAKSYHLDLLAPGEGLLTSNPDSTVLQNTKTAAIATAFATGFTALVFQWLKQHNQNNRAAFTTDLLKQTAASRQNLNTAKNVEYGHGLLNPIAILQRLSEPAQD